MDILLRTTTFYWCWKKDREGHDNDFSFHTLQQFGGSRIDSCRTGSDDGRVPSFRHHGDLCEPCQQVPRVGVGRDSSMVSLSLLGALSKGSMKCLTMLGFPVSDTTTVVSEPCRKVPGSVWRWWGFLFPTRQFPGTRSKCAKESLKMARFTVSVTRAVCWDRCRKVQRMVWQWRGTWWLTCWSTWPFWRSWTRLFYGSPNVLAWRALLSRWASPTLNY